MPLSDKSGTQLPYTDFMAPLPWKLSTKFVGQVCSVVGPIYGVIYYVKVVVWFKLDSTSIRIVGA